jgi:hypothetical protein
MTVTAPDPVVAPEPLGSELLIREARRRQRRRRCALVLLVIAAVGIYLVARPTASPSPSASLLSRPLHFPSLGSRGRCPVSSGTTFDNAYFDGVALGSGPVRVLLADGGNVLSGRVELGTRSAPGWFALQTLWFAMPRYAGPFVVRAARLGKRSPIEVRPSGNGLTSGTGPLSVGAGSTLNTQDGYRTVPGSTWITSPGCYAWQVDGRGFREVIVFDAETATQ